MKIRLKNRGGSMYNPVKTSNAKTMWLAGLMAAGLAAGAALAADPGVPSSAAYAQQAADFRAGAERHEKMAQMHKAGAGSSKVNHESIVRHCEKIAKELRAAAVESDALAAELKSAGE
jgi:hypothetical protein